MVSLKDWMKDKVRLQEEAEFETGTTRAEFIKAIKEALERKECRINQKKIRESLLTIGNIYPVVQVGDWIRKQPEDDHRRKMGCSILRH